MAEQIPETRVLSTRIPGIRYMQRYREMGLRQTEQGFSSFLGKYLPYLMIFQIRVY